MLKLFILFVASFITSVTFLAFIRKVSLRINLVKEDKKVPYVGGVGVFFSWLLAFLIFIFLERMNIPYQLKIIIVFSFVLLFVELLDDLKDFSLKTKLVFQIVFIYIFLMFSKKIQIYFLPFWVNYIISFLWIMGIMNAFNHLDVGDGVCGGVSLIVGLSFLVIFLTKNNYLEAGLVLSLLGAVLAFLLFNFPPAKMFMGNCGSHSLGFFFAALSIYGDYATLENKIALVIPVFILFFPIIDTVFLMIVRLRKGIVPLKKSDDHLFLRLIACGYSYKKALLDVYFVSILWAIAGIMILFNLSFLFLLIFLVSIFYTIRIIVKSSPR